MIYKRDRNNQDETNKILPFTNEEAHQFVTASNALRDKINSENKKEIITILEHEVANTELSITINTINNNKSKYVIEKTNDITCMLYTQRLSVDTYLRYIGKSEPFASILKVFTHSMEYDTIFAEKLNLK